MLSTYSKQNLRLMENLMLKVFNLKQWYLKSYQKGIEKISSF